MSEQELIAILRDIKKRPLSYREQLALSWAIAKAMRDDNTN